MHYLLCELLACEMLKKTKPHNPVKNRNKLSDAGSWVKLHFEILFYRSASEAQTSGGTFRKLNLSKYGWNQAEQ